MRFVLKAIFFLAVAAAFIPRSPSAESVAPPETPALTDVETAAGDFCERKPAVCQMAGESAFVARVVGGMAVEQARQMMAEAAAEPSAAQPAQEPTDASAP